MLETKKVVLVLGMHRSGTSAVTAALQYLGFELGSTLIAPNAENPKGFFENEEIVQFNDHVLRSLNLAWDSVGFTWDIDFYDTTFDDLVHEAKAILDRHFAKSTYVAIKDPRLCILLPFWQRVFNGWHECHLQYVLTVRNPLSCALSQQKRHLADPDFHVIGKYVDQMLLLWFTYMRKAVQSLRADPCVVCAFEDVIVNPEGLLTRLAEFAGRLVTCSIVQTYCNEFISKVLLRQSCSTEELAQACGDVQFVYDLYVELVALCAQGNISEQTWQAILERIPDFLALSPVYQAKTEQLHGMAYHTAVSLRGRLISVIQELSAERQNVEQVRKALDQQRQALEHERQRLAENELQLTKAYSDIQRLESELLQTRNEL